MLECTCTVKVVYIPERRIFEGVEQHHLPLYILYEAEQQVELVFFVGKRRMLFKEFLDDLLRTHLLFISFFAIIKQQRKQDACFFDAVKRQRSKQAVIKLELDAHVIFELLQSFTRLMIH